jgi:hypothetical protein
MTTQSRGSASIDVLGVKMEEVLYGARKAPLTRDQLYKFLEKERSNENLDFWLSVAVFKQQVLNEKAIISGQTYVLPLPTDVEQGLEPLLWAKRICEDYIGDQARKAQLNISGNMTKKILDDINSNKIPDFTPPQNEAVSMMLVPFQRWVQKQFEQNIDDEEIDRRKYLTILFLCITLALGLALQYTVVQSSALPRWGLFLVLLPTSYETNYFFWTHMFGL